MVFKWKDDHTPLILGLLEDRQCLWNTKVPKYKNKVSIILIICIICIICFYFTMKLISCVWFVSTLGSKRERALGQVVEELNLDGVTIDDLKAKIKTIRTRYASELSKVQNSLKCGAGTDDIYIPKLFWYKQADTFLRSVCVPRRSTSTQVSIMLIIIPLKQIIIKLRNKNSEH